MNESAPFQIVFEDQEALAEAWTAGLHRGVVTPRTTDERDIGPCEVVIELAFAGLTLRVPGKIFHAGRVLTIVRLDDIPAELKAAAAGGPPKGSAGAQPTATHDEPAQESASQDDPPGGRPSYWALRLRKDGARRPRTPVQGDENRPRKEPEAGGATTRAFDASESIVRGPGLPIPGSDERLIPGTGLFDGSLDRTSPSALLVKIYCRKLTGVCVLDGGDRRYWAYFVQGRPVHYERRPVLQSESIESILLRRKLLSPPILERALWHAAITALPVPMVIRQLELVAPARLDQVLVEHLQLVTRRLMDWDRGRFRFFEASDLHRLFQTRPLDPAKLLWSRATLRAVNLSASQADAELHEIMPLFVSLNQQGRVMLKRLPLEEAERRLLDRLRRPNRRVRKVLRTGDLPKRGTGELLLAARMLGLLELSATGPETRSEAEQEKERKLRERLSRLHMDHFRFLGLHWAALPREVQQALDLLVIEVQDFSTIGADITNYGTIRDDLSARITELRQFTRDHDRRRAYRRDLLGETELLMATENYLNRGEMALFRHDQADARECFERVLEIDPGGAGARKRIKRARDVLKEMVP